MNEFGAICPKCGQSGCLGFSVGTTKRKQVPVYERIEPSSSEEEDIGPLDIQVGTETLPGAGFAKESRTRISI